MIILVTGGAGFIGSHLCRYLVTHQMGHIISVDNYSTGKKENHVKGVTYIDESTETFNFNMIPAPDLVFHLGEYSRIEQSYEDIDLVMSSNIKGTLNILKQCVQYQCKLIYAGSSSSFGLYDSKGISPYTWTKKSNVDLIKQYHQWFQLPYVVTYFYNVYGPGEIATGKYATVVAKFLQKKKEGQMVHITAPGTQVRNFTHVNDIIDGLVLAGLKGVNNEYFAIGSDEQISIIELADLIGVPYIITESAQGNRLSSSINTDKIRSMGWSPKHNLRSYIQSYAL